eukprot:scaffold9502_cov90-Isochrysis_galbana.AAC.2
MAGGGPIWRERKGGCHPMGIRSSRSHVGGCHPAPPPNPSGANSVPRAAPGLPRGPHAPGEPPAPAQRYGATGRTGAPPPPHAGAAPERTAAHRGPGA